MLVKKELLVYVFVLWVLVLGMDSTYVCWDFHRAVFNILGQGASGERKKENELSTEA